MRIKHLIAQLNNKLKDTDFSDITTHTQFHERVASSLRDVLPPRFHYSCWTIDYDYEQHSSLNILQVERDFVKYKNCRWADRGRFNNVRVGLYKQDDDKYQPSVDGIEDVHLEDFEKEINKRIRKNKIKNAQEWVAEAKKKLEEAETYLASL